MASFSRSDDLTGATFYGANLTGARFAESDLTGVVMRGVEVAKMDIDAPWLREGGTFLVNGVDVIGFVEAELDRRFPGRASRFATDPDGLRSAWATLQDTWSATLDRAAALPPGAVDASVDGEWSFAQTLRHLVHATDVWLGRGILEQADPYHPLGQADSSQGDSAPVETPAYAEVLEVRAGRVAMVGDFLASVTPDALDSPRKNPHSPDHPETVRSCLHVILEEEWEHLRFATRDLDTLTA
jgi:uncharacterized damage-inducible protein DinB